MNFMMGRVSTKLVATNRADMSPSSYEWPLKFEHILKLVQQLSAKDKARLIAEISPATIDRPRLINRINELAPYNKAGHPSDRAALQKLTDNQRLNIVEDLEAHRYLAAGSFHFSPVRSLFSLVKGVGWHCGWRHPERHLPCRSG